MSDVLLTVEIPQYPTKIKVSNCERAVYYKKKDKLPKKYCTEEYSFTRTGGILIDGRGRPVLKNPSKVGKEKFEILSGNKLNSGYGSPIIRNLIARQLKDFYRPYVRVLDPLPLEVFPLRIEWDIYTTVNIPNFDLSNLWFYYKYFEDTLHEIEDPRDADLPFKLRRQFVPIIPDDSIRYVTHPGNNPKLIPVAEYDDRKFIFRLYSDRRPEIMAHPLWQKQWQTLLLQYP